MASPGAGDPRCPQTGLTVPECSCEGCLERMLREFSPDLLTGEIRIARASADPERSTDRREAA